MVREAHTHSDKGVSHAAAVVRAEVEIASDEMARNAVISHEGTRRDQQDMMRMGKSQQLKVCLSSPFLKMRRPGAAMLTHPAA